MGNKAAVVVPDKEAARAHCCKSEAVNQNIVNGVHTGLTNDRLAVTAALQARAGGKQAGCRGR